MDFEYKNQDYFWNFPTQPKLLEVDIDESNQSMDGNERYDFKKNQVRNLTSVFNEDVENLRDRYAKYQDFDLKLAEATLFEEFKSLRHGLLGHKFDRLIYPIDAKSEERSKLKELKKKWTVKIALYLVRLHQEGYDLKTAIYITREAIKNEFQNLYLSEREKIKCYYRIGYKPKYEIKASDSNLWKIFQDNTIPKFEKKLKQNELQRIYHEKIKNELKSFESKSSVKAKRVLSIRRWYKNNLPKIKTRMNLIGKVERIRGGSATPQRLPNLTENINEIQSFLSNSTGGQNNNVPIQGARNRNQNLTVPSVTPNQARQATPRSINDTFNTSGNQELDQLLYQLKQSYRANLAETFLVLHQGTIRDLESLPKIFKNLHREYRQNKIQLFQTYGLNVSDTSSIVSQNSLVNVILKPLMPPNTTIDQLIMNRLREMRRINPRPGSSRALDATFSSPIERLPQRNSSRTSPSRNVTFSTSPERPNLNATYARSNASSAGNRTFTTSPERNNTGGGQSQASSMGIQSFTHPSRSPKAESSLDKNATFPAYKKPKVTKFVRAPTSPKDLTSEDILHMIDDLPVSLPSSNIVPLLPIFSPDRCVCAAEIPTSQMNYFDKNEIEKALLEVGGRFDLSKVRTNFLTLDTLKICDIVEDELNPITQEIDPKKTKTELVKIVGQKVGDSMQIRGDVSALPMVFPNEDPQPKLTSPEVMVNKALCSMGADSFV